VIDVFGLVSFIIIKFLHDKDMSISHRFYSVLTNHPDVLRQSQRYPTAIEEKTKIPESFDGRDIWGTYLIAPSSTDTKSASWAIVAKNILNDRFCLQSGGQLLTNFDEFEILSCIETPPSKSDKPYDRATQGYSIFDAWEYLYQYGVCQKDCFPIEAINKQSLTSPYELASYTDKIREYGTGCSKIEDPGRTRCLTMREGKPVARRAFFCDSFYNVGRGKTKEESIERIKTEIVRYGPVAAGIMIYENFIEGLTDPTKWRGHTPYEKVSGKVLGAHYISIVGFERDYWICRNTWGSMWGLLGYVKIKIGIPSLALEENVSACMPYMYRRAGGEGDIPGEMPDGKRVNLFEMRQFNPYLAKLRDHLKIDFLTFYTVETLDMIKRGELAGKLTPLIQYPLYLPDMRYFWVKDILEYTYPTLSTDSPVSDFWWKLFVFVLCCVATTMGIRNK